MSKISDISVSIKEGTLTEAEAKQLIGAKEIQETKYRSDKNADYWRKCRGIVVLVGKIIAKEKFLMNLRDPEKCHAVKEVFEKNFGGDITRVKQSRRTLIEEFLWEVDQLNWFASRNGLSQVSAIRLLALLEDEKQRRKFRSHIDKHIESEHPMFELDEIPSRDFRPTKKPP